MARLPVSTQKKVLILSPAASTLVFCTENILSLIRMGCEVHVAANFEHDSSATPEFIQQLKEWLYGKGVCIHSIPFVRRSFIRNVKAVKAYRKLLKEQNFSLIHCHTETGGLITRLAAPKKLCKSAYIIFTPHGFSFYKNAPLRSWFLYYPVERLISGYMDELISINQEDYVISEKFKSRKKTYIPGVGLNTRLFTDAAADRTAKRAELGVPENALLLLSVGELSKWKNHQIILKTIAAIKNPNLYFVVCGCGKLEKKLKKAAARYKIEKHVVFAGFRCDMPQVYKAADIFAFPSFHEGLPVALMEAMASGLPVVCSAIRGNNDLIKNNRGGYLLKPDDKSGFRKAIRQLAEDPALRLRMGKVNQASVKQYDAERVRVLMETIYKNALADRP